jgi:hypothetical protein
LRRPSAAAKLLYVPPPSPAAERGGKEEMRAKRKRVSYWFLNIPVSCDDYVSGG